MSFRSFSDQRVDSNGNPAGGVSCGCGFTISWQDGPLGRGYSRKEPNGASVESVIAAVVGRLEFYQQGKFNCYENATAITHLDAVLELLNGRTKDREKRKVECVHEV